MMKTLEGLILMSKIIVVFCFLNFMYMTVKALLDPAFLTTNQFNLYMKYFIAYLIFKYLEKVLSKEFKRLLITHGK